MRSKRVTVRLPWTLYEALEHVCKARGFDHMHACIIGACMVLVLNEPRRNLVLMVANAKPKEQDWMMDKILSFKGDKAALMQALKKL